MRIKIGYGLLLICLFIMSSCTVKQSDNTKNISLPKIVQKQVKIACVGDSITYGHTIEQREAFSYPAQFQEMIKHQGEVINFGFNGAGIQKASNVPYWNQAVFEKSLRYQPDIVYLMLGTNDAKDINWLNKEIFKKDYLAFLKEYQNLASHPTIYIMTPSTAYALEENGSIFHDISLENIKKIVGIIKEIAKEENIEVIDIYEVTQAHQQNYLIDGVHPDRFGATRIAKTVYETYEKNRLINIIEQYQTWFISDVLKA